MQHSHSSLMIDINWMKQFESRNMESKWHLFRDTLSRAISHWIPLTSKHWRSWAHLPWLASDIRKLKRGRNSVGIESEFKNYKVCNRSCKQAELVRARGTRNYSRNILTVRGRQKCKQALQNRMGGLGHKWQGKGIQYVFFFGSSPEKTGKS